MGTVQEGRCELQTQQQKTYMLNNVVDHEYFALFTTRKHVQTDPATILDEHIRNTGPYFGIFGPFRCFHIYSFHKLCHGSIRKRGL